MAELEAEAREMLKARMAKFPKFEVGDAIEVSVCYNAHYSCTISLAWQASDLRVAVLAVFANFLHSHETRPLLKAIHLVFSYCYILMF